MGQLNPLDFTISWKFGGLKDPNLQVPKISTHCFNDLDFSALINRTVKDIEPILDADDTKELEGEGPVSVLMWILASIIAVSIMAAIILVMAKKNEK